MFQAWPFREDSKIFISAKILHNGFHLIVKAISSQTRVVTLSWQGFGEKQKVTDFFTNDYAMKAKEKVARKDRENA